MKLMAFVIFARFPVAIIFLRDSFSQRGIIIHALSCFIASILILEILLSLVKSSSRIIAHCIVSSSQSRCNNYI